MIKRGKKILGSPLFLKVRPDKLSPSQREIDILLLQRRVKAV